MTHVFPLCSFRSVNATIRISSLLRRARAATATGDYFDPIERVGVSVSDSIGAAKVILRSNQPRRHLNIQLTAQLLYFMASDHAPDESITVEEWRSFIRACTLFLHAPCYKSEYLPLSVH